MKFRTKLLLSRLIVFIFLILLMLFAYKVSINEYRKYIHNEINREIAIKQQNIASSISIAMQNQQINIGCYSQIHQGALRLYKDNPDISLEDIKVKLVEEFGTAASSVNLFLINRDKVIYEATLAKDVGYDLSKYSEPAQLIDDAFSNNDIHISKSVSQDILDGTYKTFSYAKATDDTILELSFVDDSASEVFRLIQQGQAEQMQATLYTVYHENQDYFYFEANDAVGSDNKKEAYNNAPKFNKNNYHSDPVISAFLTNKPVAFEDEAANNYFYYTNLFTEPNLETEFENIVVKYDVPLQERKQFLQLIRQFFLSIFAFAVLAILGIHTFINKQLKPIDVITRHIRKSELIPINKLNNQTDEFYIIAKEYNHVFSELNKEIEKNASKVYIDSLTQAGNRQAFDEQLEGLIKTFNEDRHFFTMILLDIDDFKGINDKFGHLTGDKVLQEVSDLVKGMIRGKDSFYRVGGEEFVLLLADTKLDAAIEVAQRVRAEVEAQFIDWETGKITISAGICEMKDGHTYETLYKCADNMLYQAKAQGKNQVCYNDIAD